MPRIIDYMVVSVHNGTDAVIKYMKDGWAPFGTPISMPMYVGQTLVKYEDSDLKNIDTHLKKLEKRAEDAEGHLALTEARVVSSQAVIDDLTLKNKDLEDKIEGLEILNAQLSKRVMTSEAIVAELDYRIENEVPSKPSWCFIAFTAIMLLSAMSHFSSLGNDDPSSMIHTMRIRINQA